MDTSFIQTSSRDIPIPGTDSIAHEGITCFECNGSKHYRDKSPQSNIQLVQYSTANQKTITTPDSDDKIVNDADNAITENDNNVVVAFDFLQARRKRNQARHNTIPQNYILLDSDSNVYTFFTPHLASNICPHIFGWTVEVHTNGGT